MIKLNFFYKIKFLVYLLWKNKKKIILKSPPKKKLLIVDDVTINHLNKTILKNLDYSLVSTRPQFEKEDRNDIDSKYYISIKIIIYFVLGLLKKLNFKTSYIYSYIKCSKPNIVLNNCHDWNLIKISKLLKKINFVLLCHGNWFDFTNKGKKLYERLDMTWLPNEISKIELKNHLKNFYILLRGQKDIDLFKKIGVNKVNFISIGSYEASYYKSLKLNNQKKFDILFVSQLVNSCFTNPTKLDDIYKTYTSKILSLLSRYSLEKKLSVAYLCRGTYENNIKENNFAKDTLKKCNYTIIENKNNALWESIYTSNIVTTIDSTVGHDAIFIEKKTMLFPMSFNDRFFYATKPDRKINELWEWTIAKNNYQEFKKKMDNLINITPDVYKKKTAKYRNYNFYNHQEESNEITYKFIKNLI